MKLITAVRRLIDTATAYKRRLIDAAEARQAARTTGDACVADSLVRTTGMARRDAHRAAWRSGPGALALHSSGAARPPRPASGPRRAGPARHVTPSIYDDFMNIKKCPAGFSSPYRHRCHTPSLRLSHAN